MTRLILVLAFAAAAFAGLSTVLPKPANAQVRMTSVPQIQESDERPALDLFTEMMAGLPMHAACTAGQSAIVIGGRVVECTDMPVVEERPHGRHHRRSRHAHNGRRSRRHHRHAQPVVINETVLAATALARPTVSNARTVAWERIGIIRSQLSGMNISDPGVDGLMTEARGLLLQLGYDIRAPHESPSMLATAAPPTR